MVFWMFFGMFWLYDLVFGPDPEAPGRRFLVGGFAFLLVWFCELLVIFY